MLCESCGKQRDEGGVFCPHCGAKLTSLPTSANDATEMDHPAKNEQLVQMYQEYLRSEGYLPELDSAGDLIRVKIEGRTFRVYIEPDDDEFLNIAFFIYKIENEEERARIERAALQATARTKVAKVSPEGDLVWASVEIFCSPIENFKQVFHRSIRALRAAESSFCKTMAE